MTKLPKFFLIVSLTTFAVGTIVCLTNVNVHPCWMVALPLGAVFFGLFLNAYLLQGEMTKFDEETRLRFEWVKRHAPRKTSGREIRSEAVPASGTFCTANHH